MLPHEKNQDSSEVLRVAHKSIALHASSEREVEAAGRKKRLTVKYMPPTLPEYPYNDCLKFGQGCWAVPSSEALQLNIVCSLSDQSQLVE